jgi:hypothetical protein
MIICTIWAEAGGLAARGDPSSRYPSLCFYMSSDWSNIGLFVSSQSRKKTVSTFSRWVGMYHTQRERLRRRCSCIRRQCLTFFGMQHPATQISPCTPKMAANAPKPAKQFWSYYISTVNPLHNDHLRHPLDDRYIGRSLCKDLTKRLWPCNWEGKICTLGKLNTMY